MTAGVAQMAQGTVLLLGTDPAWQASWHQALAGSWPRLQVMTVETDALPVHLAPLVAAGTPLVSLVCAEGEACEAAVGLLRRAAPAAVVALASDPGEPAGADLLCIADDLVRLDGDTALRVAALLRRAQERADTERSRRDREALRRQGEERDLAARRYEGIAEHAEQAILTFDREDRIDYLNPAMVALSGYTVEELAGQPCVVLFFEDDREAALTRLAARKRGWRAKSQFRIRRRDGAAVWVEGTGAPMRDGRGRVIGRLSMLTDITDRRAHDHRVRQALADRETLLREVHHRVRNNFQIISSLFNLQFHDLEQADLRGRIRDTQNRIATMALLHALLYQSDDLATARADQYLARIVDVLVRSYDAGHITVSVEADPVRLCTDNGMRFGLIVNELVSNAFKHAFPGRGPGQVHVRLRFLGPADASPEVTLEVADNGIGFVEDGAPTGRGLGLQLVRDMVGQLEGRVDVLPPPGAIVRMSFPADRVIR
ncbi:MAG: PAS domain S-box protein [Vicinamibacterales bacterium]|nr:PAS domain S-box protein [Vicinamibacterales bacterium]